MSIKNQLSIFIYISIFILNNSKKILYPTILTLLSQKIVQVTNDGIHFFDSEYSNEKTDKFISLNIPTVNDNYKTALAQFSENDDGYILILVMNVLYIFYPDGTRITSYNISNIINGDYYCITPYKKESNKLYYFISYVDKTEKTIVLHYFNFDIKSHTNEQQQKNFEVKTKSKNTSPNNIIGVTCMFMNYSSEYSEVLSCIYGIDFPFEIHIRSFDPNNNFNEITDIYKYMITSDSEFVSVCPYVSGITNLKRNKMLIYLSYVSCGIWLTFDFENGFSSYTKYDCEGIKGYYPLNKMIYFRQTDEFVVFSNQNGCDAYVFIFTNDFSIKTTNSVTPTNCYGSNFFSIYFKDQYYVIVSDSNNNNYNGLLSKIITDFGTSSTVEDPIDLEIDYEQNEISTIIYPQPETTIIDESTNYISETTIIDDNSILDSSIIEENSNSITENLENFSNNIKCKSSDINSSKYNLCTSCNTDEGYYPVENENYTLFHGFVECYNNDTKPINFYYNTSSNKYKICYETCLTCDGDGDEFNNNCLTCDYNHIKLSDYPHSKNCIPQCSYSYYYTTYGQYKCSESINCPKDYNLFIKELKKCTHNCNKEEKYKYQYGGCCLEHCPEGTNANINNICIISDINKCSKSENENIIQEYLSTNSFDLNIKNYIKEFNNTEKHISFFINNEYSILLYQDLNCIKELNFDIDKIDFKSCYTKIQNSISPITDKIIIGLIKNNTEQKSKLIYYFYHPKTGEKINVEEMCKDEEIIIKENILSKINTSNVDMNSVLFMAEQNINVFDLSSDFYTDICYNFESPNGRDILLNERIQIYYPNITLCDNRCKNKGVNLTSMESICECNFKDILNNDLIEGNTLLEETFGDLNDIIINSNLDVLKCFKDVFKSKNIKKSYGGFIILGIFFLEIIFSFIFQFKDIYLIIKYIYKLSEDFILCNENTHKNPLLKNKRKQLIIRHKKKIKNPPKKSKRKKRQRKISKEKSNSFYMNPNNNNNKNILNKKFSIISSKFSESNKILQKTNNYNNEFSSQNQNIGECSNSDKINEFFNTDLDNMDYDDAIKKDKRTFSQFFSDRIKTNLIILDTFCNKDNIIF